MPVLSRTPRSPGLFLTVAGLGALGALGTAMVAQFIFSLPPCTLCIWQRWPHVAVLAVCVACLGVRCLVNGPAHRTRYRQAAWLVVGLFALNAGLSGLHAGIELGWWEVALSCSGGTPAPTDPAALLAHMPVRCDHPAWEWHGITLAGLHVPYNLGLLVAGLVCCLPGTGEHASSARRTSASSPASPHP